MKFFAFTMSVYLLLLCCVPCSDNLECIIVGQTVSAGTNHNQHTHAKEYCTPFCTCSCCTVSILRQALPFYQAPVFEMEKYVVYIPSFSAVVSSAIWQPPRIA